MIKELLSAGRRSILLNLHDVNYIDSVGLGVLVGAYATVTNQGGEIKLVNLQSRVRDLLQLTKLYTVFESYTDEVVAVASFDRRAGDRMPAD
jgi:anti-sigma B factor antagonist